MKYNILLPGLDRQAELTLQKLDPAQMDILVIGSFSEQIALLFAERTNAPVHLIVEDTESLLNSNLVLSSSDKIRSALMSYEKTDFPNASFDLVYAQASISGENRNKTVKEIKRILKPGGYLSAGEVVKLVPEVPPFIKNIFTGSLLDPLFTGDINKYYESRNFTIAAEHDLTATLAQYYSMNAEKLTEASASLTEGEKKYYKKLLNKVSHETNAYLKHGGGKYIGFKYLLLQKGQN